MLSKCPFAVWCLTILSYFALYCLHTLSTHYVSSFSIQSTCNLAFVALYFYLFSTLSICILSPLALCCLPLACTNITNKREIQTTATPPCSHYQTCFLSSSNLNDETCRTEISNRFRDDINNYDMKNH